jgi:hypothetical protein
MKKVSTLQKVLAVLALLACIGGGMVFGLWVSGGLGHLRDSSPPAPPDAEANAFAGTMALSIVLGFLSVVAILGGALLYLLIVGARLFVFEFTRPVWSRFKTRLFIVNIFVPLVVMFGLSGFIAAISTVLLASAGIANPTASVLLFFGPFILLQLTFVWLSVWTPLILRLARSRLLAIGIEPARLQEGTFLGISDPAKKSSRKMGLIEEDIGMLWINPDALVYRGDNDAFCVRRDQLISIERIADAGSVSAYFGNVHIILTFKPEGAPPRRVRLHPESSWTMTGIARATNDLAKALEQWKGPVPAEAAQL